MFVHQETNKLALTQNCGNGCVLVRLYVCESVECVCEAVTDCMLTKGGGSRQTK